MTDARWALPEEAPPADEPRGQHPHDATRTPMASAAPARASRPVPALPVFDRPLTVADVLDGSFQMIKARPRVIIGIASLLVLPLGVVVALADLGALGGDVVTTLTDPDTFEQDANTSETDLGFTVVSGLITSALVTLMAAPIARVVESWYVGREITVAQAVRGIGPGWLSIAVAFVIVHVLEAVGTVMLILPGLAVMALAVPVTPLIAIERLGPFAAVARSFRLAGRRFWPMLWIALLSGLVATTLSLMLPLLPLAIVGLVGFGGEQYVVAVGTIAASLVALPFVAGTAVLAYFDLRVRSEGLDLQLAITDQFAASS